ncbi:hypothetical protein ABMA28_016068 [Loxostege sticticalis]|uniref:FP protein C-terminal domain-containing protein n=1 Tax=Loxostege sticticalis TaxID=481309 RepID=A0ABD0T7S9_LOXSC
MMHSPRKTQEPRFGSAPDLHQNTDLTTSDDDNVTLRSFKRPRCDCETTSESKLDIFINSITAWRLETDNKLSSIQACMNEIKKQNGEILASNAEIEKSIDFLSQKYDDLSTKMNDFQCKTKAHDERLSRLELNLDDIERTSRSSNLEIRNLHFKQRVSQEELINTTILIFKELSVEVLYSDLYDIRILPSKSDNKTILITLKSVILKNNILRAYRGYNQKSTKLSTAILDKDTPPRMIYIAENLTPKARKLFLAAREFAKQENYRHCWTAHGKILLRKEDNAKITLISSETQLLELKSKN